MRKPVLTQRGSARTLQANRGGTSAQQPVCIVCGDRAFDSVIEVADDRHGVAGVFPILACRTCGHEITRVDLRGTDIAALYAGSYTAPRAGKAESLYIRMRDAAFRSPLFRLWLRYDGDQYFVSQAARERGARLLDFGCFEGRQLALFNAAGYRAEGLEFNPVAARVARAKGFTVHDCEARALAGKQLYDVIVMSHVIEHLPDPEVVLAELRPLLADGGVLRISCPNTASLYRRLFGRHWSNWHVPFHLHHFSGERLCGLLARAGYRVDRIGSITPSHAVAVSILNRLGRRGAGKHRRVAVVVPLMLFTAFALKPLNLVLNGAGRGDCLVVEARKS